MKQSRLMSLVEAIANVVVGYGIAVATQLVVFPWFGIEITLAEQAGIGAAFTAVSIVRSFALRRLFEAVRDGRAAGWPMPMGDAAFTIFLTAALSAALWLALPG